MNYFYICFRCYVRYIVLLYYIKVNNFIESNIEYDGVEWSIVWICAMRHGAIAISHVLDLLSGGQTTHAAQRTAKSTLTYELGTGEFPLLLFCFFIPAWKRKKNERIVQSFRDLFCAFSPFSVYLSKRKSFSCSCFP